AFVDQAKSQVIGSADIAKIIQMFVGSTDGQQVLAACSHAGAVIGHMKPIGTALRDARRADAVPVAAAGAQDFLNGRIAKGVQAWVFIADLVNVQHAARLPIKMLQDAGYKCGTKNRVRITQDADVPLSRQQAKIVEPVFVEKVIVWIAGDNP